MNGLGPDTASPQAMRFANVAKVIDPPPGTYPYLDLEVTAAADYLAGTPARNGLSGRFARVDVHANTCGQLQISVKPSCATADSCDLCDDTELYATTADHTACYARGCACFGTTVNVPAACEGTERERLRSVYACPGMDANGTFPSGSLHKSMWWTVTLAWSAVPASSG